MYTCRGSIYSSQTFSVLDVGGALFLVKRRNNNPSYFKYVTLDEVGPFLSVE